MKYIVGTLYILIAVLLFLFSILSIFGGINNILEEIPNETNTMIVMYGKVLLIYPLIAYGSFKLGKKGINKFKSSSESEMEINT